MDKFKLSYVENALAKINWASPFKDYAKVAVSSKVDLDFITAKPLYRVDIKLAKRYNSDFDETVVLEFRPNGSRLEFWTKLYKNDELISKYINYLDNDKVRDAETLASLVNERLATLPELLITLVHLLKS